jgi:hypothetical protein
MQRQQIGNKSSTIAAKRGFAMTLRAGAAAVLASCRAADELRLLILPALSYQRV